MTNLNILMSRIKVGRNKKRTNVCPAESTCKTFKEIYQTADNFCERVWDHSWKYTSNDQPCMKMWFDGPENPNDDVARWKIQVMYDDDTTSPSSRSIPFSSIWTAVLAFSVKSIWTLVN